MATRVSYYELLEVTRDASGDEIKRAFRRKVRSCHPDRCPGDREAEVRFKEINEAYTVLSDPQKRAHYDRFGTAEGMDGPVSGDSVFDLMGDLFGAFTGRRSSGPVEGESRAVSLSLDLEEAARGKECTVEYDRFTPCDRCGGSGGAPDAERKVCSRCQGSGRVIQTHQTLFGMARSAVPCPDCDGRGTVFSASCPYCGGQGSVRRHEVRKVIVPASIEDGTTLRVAGGGDLPPGGVPGDLYLQIEVKEHPRFIRRGPHLFCRHELDLLTAITGGEVVVDTLLDGPVTTMLEPGTQAGTQVLFKGLGMPLAGAKRRGDLAVKFDVKVPAASTLTEGQIESLRQAFAQDREGEKPVPDQPHGLAGQQDKKGKKAKGKKKGPLLGRLLHKD